MALLVVPVGPQSAWAQVVGEAQGRLRATSYREVPERLQVVVTLYDDSDLNLAIRDRMIESLAAAGHTVDGDAAFELAVTSEMHAAAFREREPSLGELSGTDSDVQMQLNIWSSSRDSVLGGRQAPGPHREASRFEIRTTLRERTLGQVVWEGRASVETEREGASRRVPAMVSALVSHVGQTVRDGRFPLR